MPLVQEMLSKLPPETWLDPTKTFLEPSCGHGNFLVGVLAFKLTYGPSTPEQALSTVFAVDIMEDNVLEARERMLSLIERHTGHPRTPEHVRLVTSNVLCRDGLKPETWDLMNEADVSKAV